MDLSIKRARLQRAGDLRDEVRRICVEDECTCFCEPIEGKSKTTKTYFLFAHPQELYLSVKELRPILSQNNIRPWLTSVKTTE